MKEAILQFIPFFIIYFLFTAGYYYLEKYRLYRRVNTYSGYIIAAMIVLALATRLFLAGYEYGAWDVDNFATQANVAYSAGNIYELTGGPVHVYPPLNVLILLFWKHVSVVTALPFTFLYKITYIFFDIFFILIVLCLSHKSRIYKENMAFLIATSPLIILTPTVFGQIDIVPTFFTFFAFVVLKKDSLRWKCSALLLGLGIAFKTPPIILLPAFLSECPTKRRMAAFAGLALAPAICLMSVAALIFPTPEKVFANVFFYKGWISGAWGLGGFFWVLARFFEHIIDIPFARQLMENFWGWYKGHGIMLFYLCIGTSFFIFFRKISLLKRIVYTYLCFYVFSNAVSPHHVVWILPFLFYGNFIFTAGFHFWTNLVTGVYAPFVATGRLHLEKIPKLYPFVAGCLWAYACYTLIRLLGIVISEASSANNVTRCNHPKLMNKM